MEDTFLENDENTNPKQTDFFFIKSQYVYVINCMKKNYDNVLSTALRDTKVYNSYFIKINHFSLAFNFPKPKEPDLHCSDQIMLRTKQTHTYTYNKFIQLHYTTIHHHEKPIHIFKL